MTSPAELTELAWSMEGSSGATDGEGNQDSETGRMPKDARVSPSRTPWGVLGV